MAGKLTEEAIRQAFLELLEEKQFSKISIRDITDRVGINRQTFYYHYRDILDLAADIFNRACRSCVRPDLSDTLMSFYDYFTERRKSMYNIVHCEDFDAVKTRLEPELEPVIEYIVDNAVPGKRLEGEERKLTISYSATMISTFIVKWLKDGMFDSRKSFEKLATMMECNLKNTVEVFCQDSATE